MAVDVEITQTRHHAPLVTRYGYARHGGAFEADRFLGVPWHSLLEPFGRRRHVPSAHVEQRPTTGGRSYQQVACIAEPILSVEQVADPLGWPRLDAHRLAGKRRPFNPNNEPAHHPAETYL